MIPLTGSPAQDAPTWHCVHVYYHAPDKDGLLLDAVRPLFDRLRGQVEAAYVLRHWRQGPHLRINVKAAPRVWQAVVRPRIEQVVGGHLREHPSTTVLDPAESLTRHRLLAVREQEHGPLTPWPPDNSIRDAPYDSRRHVLGGDEAVDLLAAFYTDSTPLLFAMLDHVRAGRDGRLGVAMSLMLTVAHTSHPITRSYVSYRMHAEGFITWAADPEATRAAFERDFRERRAALTGRVREVVAALDDPAAPPVPFVREWSALLERYRARAGTLMEDGRLAQPMTKPGEAFEARLGDLPVPRRDPNELQRLIFDSPAYHEAVFANPAFLRYRVLLNYTYLHLTRMGLTPLDRFRLCHLLANAVEDLYGLSALDALRRFAAAEQARQGG
ncbi:thiopeptide maturation pyridine synthase [Sphaerisporangium perillae]|uniref:thiopeptide maturation pyridine synthase n=1 Tax=Sphaerisporangium perillae TaxID=2935860 RepID=UPI00200EF11F|nr:thiopeptide maturation pyridine synthase [Sphaerisporangium perillae]